MALNGGVVDLEVNRLLYDPAKPPESRPALQHGGTASRGRLGMPEAAVHGQRPLGRGQRRRPSHDDQARPGSNGNTTLSADGVVGLDGSKQGSLDLHVNLDDLELDDDRLRKRTPAEYERALGSLQAAGQSQRRRCTSTRRACRRTVRLDSEGPLSRRRGGLSAFSLSARPPDRRSDLREEHAVGRLEFAERASLCSLAGTIRNPGPDAVVKLDIKAESLPIDDAIKNAMPPDVRKVVDQFNASGLVKRECQGLPRADDRPGHRPEGLIKFDAEIDLTERCEITWVGLPYPVRNLKGRLEIHPDKWTFKDVTGSNGQAKIKASGSVEKLRLARGARTAKIRSRSTSTCKPRTFRSAASCRAALPTAWKKTWPTINPSGSCDVEAGVHVAPGGPNARRSRSAPRPESNVRLLVTRSPQPGIDPGGTIELPMDDVHGQFVFDNGEVTMNDVNFNFRGSPVRFSRGTVLLEESGQFDLDVQDAWVEEIRFDLDLRKKMPPLMAQFALRLDGGGPFRARAISRLAGRVNERDLAWCRWKNTKVVFNDNSVRTAIPLEHIQGQLENVSGWSNGMALEVEGILKLESVSFMGQQITQLESPFHVKEGQARLDSVRGHFLGGEVLGDDACSISLDATPRYHVALSLKGAQLEEYARTISGRQSYRGLIDARIAIDGLGSDVRSIHGRGEAHISQGDLGELPPVLRLASVVNSVPNLSVASEDRNRSRGQDGVRLGRCQLHDRQRHDHVRPDQVHRQRLQPAGQRNARSTGLSGPPAQPPVGSRSVSHPARERLRPPGEQSLLHRPRQRDALELQVDSRAPPPRRRRPPGPQPHPRRFPGGMSAACLIRTHDVLGPRQHQADQSPLLDHDGGLAHGAGLERLREPRRRDDQS